MADDQRGERDDVGRHVGELVGQALTLQADTESIGEAEQHAGAGRVKRIVARQHHRDHGDPAAPGAHVLGKQVNVAERKLCTGKPAECARHEHGDHAIIAHIEAERLRCVRLLADSAEAKANRCPEQNVESLAYSASKAGLISMTRMLSETLATHDINVNCVCPGGVATPMLREVSVAYSGVTGEAPEAIFDKMVSQQLVRHLQPIEVARVVSFLLSDDAMLVRGQAVNADAGETPY